MPFNIGFDSGAGNPPGADGQSATAYLWERVWEKHAWLNIIGRLMIVQTKEDLCAVLTPELSSGYTGLVTNAVS